MLTATPASADPPDGHIPAACDQIASDLATAQAENRNLTARIAGKDATIRYLELWYGTVLDQRDALVKRNERQQSTIERLREQVKRQHAYIERLRASH